MSKENFYPNFIINGYSTKRIVDVKIENNIEQWCEIKTGGPFSILYNPENNNWLKTTTCDKSFEYRIEQSYQAQLAVLHLIGGTSLIDQCTVTEISTGKDFFNIRKGLITPHFGPTIQSIIKSNKENKFSKDDLNWFYYQGFVLAKELLKETGWWMDDPNSGNIVISDTENLPNNRVILIDFSNKDSRKKYNSENVKKLESNFKRQAKRVGLSDW